ncbi:helix-turn-helix transcriptional regulator [Sphingomonas sp. J315]|uniref:helix-turn-helix transcriptional regulator n=1 Tax=Sphingomonas sp. J315 TaxID=2898433 RepID=UPI0021AD84DB|nr:hypothetical protein [Sphingomonas sp. J315]UUX99572.1 hypothetical protein LRS08_19480 [Sphingomonas sp. J315]
MTETPIAATRGIDRPGMAGGVDPSSPTAAAIPVFAEQAAQVQSLLQQALAARVSGLILLDGVGNPSFVDDGARAILAARDGLRWECDGFAAVRGPETRRLCQMISCGLSRGPAAHPAMRMQMLVTRNSGCRPYLVRVIATSCGEVVCAVHIFDLGIVHLPDPVVLREVFGLTQREADLAIELVRAGGLASAAAAAGMAHNTARNHLHGIFAKCCVMTQAEAVRLLAALP